MRSLYIKYIFQLILLLACTFGSSYQAAAKDVEIQDVVITNSSEDLLLFLNIANAFTPEIIQGVENGIPATFTFEVNLSLVRSGWPNNEIVSRNFDHTLVYDNLKKEYTVVLDEENGKSITTDKSAYAQQVMSELNGLRLTGLKNLFPDRNYIVEARVTLAKKSLPFYFQYLIPFGNFGDFSTDWYTVEFRY